MDTFKLPSTHTEAVQRNNARYDNLIASGGFAPNTYPLNWLMLLIPFLYLVLPRRFNFPWVRYSTLTAMSAFALYHVFFTRAKHASTSGLIGIFNTFAIMWGVAHIGLIDPRKEHARIISMEPAATGQQTPEATELAKDGHNNRPDVSREPHTTSLVYRWQTIPDSFLGRCDWATDLFTSLDGAGWEWAVPSVPAPPRRVQQSLSLGKDAHDIDMRVMEKKWSRLGQNKELVTASEMLRQSVKQFCVGYLVTDVFKTLICNDPWFFGQLDAPPPSYLPAFLHFELAVKGLRLFIGQGCVHYAIQNVLVLRTIIYLLPGVREHIGVRGEAWVHSSTFGSFQTVLDRGLLGFWSDYWHQAFRHVFSAPTRPIVQKFNLHPQSGSAQLIRLFMAFCLSGILHAAISYASLGESYPLRPFVFFMVQACGIIAQIVFLHLVFQLPGAAKLPKWVRQASNLGWILFWGYYTAPLLIEDFARGGSFLLEAVPLSPLRGLGLGREGDGFLCWRGQWFTWHVNGWRSYIEV